LIKTKCKTQLEIKVEITGKCLSHANKDTIKEEYIKNNNVETSGAGVLGVFSFVYYRSSAASHTF